MWWVLEGYSVNIRRVLRGIRNALGQYSACIRMIFELE